MKKKAFLYQRLYDDIRRNIEQGAFSAGQLLPSERELGETYGVDRTTVRRALQMLSDDHLVSKLPGKGTIVAMPNGSAVQESPVSSMGVRLPGNQMRTVGFFIPQNKKVADKIMFPTYTSLLYLTEQECSEHNIRLIYSALDEQKELDDYLSTMRFDGIIFLSTIADKHLARALELGIPSVLLNNHRPEIISICTDNLEGGACVARYLLDQGHRDIMLLAGNRVSINCRERIQGFCDELTVHGLSCYGGVFGGTSWTFEAGYEETKRALSELPAPPTALFACGDRLALGALKAFQEAGLEVPRDVSIVGYDYSEQAQYANPKLTSVDTNLKALSATAMRALQGIFNDPTLATYPLKVMVPPTLVEHDSVLAR